MDNYNAIDFGKRLRQALNQSKVQQYELAEAIGVSKTAINNYVQGKFPTVPILLLICAHLNISIEWLLTGKPEGDCSLDEQEQELLGMFRQLPPYDQKDSFDIIKMKLDRTEMEVASSKWCQNSGETA